MSGWFSVKRGITQHPIFAMRPDRAFVWLWMLETAAYRDTRQDAGGRPVEVKRGQVLTSLRQIEKATGVGIQVIRTLLDLLRDEHAINTDTSAGRLLITICNYDKYQTPPDVNGTPSNTAPTQRQHTKETREQIPTTSGASAPDDPAAFVFASGRALLVASGRSHGQAGSIIGKWRKAHSDAEIIEAIGRAKREGAVDPVEFIEGCFRFKAQRKAFPEIGDTRDFNGVSKTYMGVGAGWLVNHA